VEDGRTTKSSLFNKVRKELGMLTGGNAPRLSHLNVNAAFYMHMQDLVCVGTPTRFVNHSRYAYIVCHELAHATAHPSRLDRQGIHLSWINNVYRGREEITAELSAMMVMNQLGLLTDYLMNAGTLYLSNWTQGAVYDMAEPRRQKEINDSFEYGVHHAYRASNYILNGR
jgi:antirestriction protein ArdC